MVIIIVIVSLGAAGPPKIPMVTMADKPIPAAVQQLDDSSDSKSSEKKEEEGNDLLSHYFYQYFIFIRRPSNTHLDRSG